VPPGLIALASGALGRAQRLGGTLVADPGKFMQAGWKPYWLVYGGK